MGCKRNRISKYPPNLKISGPARSQFCADKRVRPLRETGLSVSSVPLRATDVGGGPSTSKMGCAGSKSGGGVLADAPVRNLGNRDPPSSTPLPEPAEDNSADMKTLMQQNQEMMHLFRLSQQAAVVSPPLAPSTTTAAPVMVAPNDGEGGGGKEVDGGEEDSSKLSRSASRTVLPSSLTPLGVSVQDDLQESDSGVEEKVVVSALDAVFFVES